MKKGSAGGIATAIILKRKALERYYSNPNYCLHCNSIIQVKENQRVSEVRVKKFCNKSCSAKYNNKLKGRICRSKEEERESRKRCKCPKCEKPIKCSSKVCISCVKLEQGKVTKGKFIKRFKSRTNARVSLQGKAKRNYIKNNPNTKCFCGYSKHLQVCHIKSISSFSDDTLISEINDPSNLIGMCPNHHWEYDNGCLDITLEEVLEIINNTKIKTC